LTFYSLRLFVKVKIEKGNSDVKIFFARLSSTFVHQLFGHLILFFGIIFCCMAIVPGHDVILFCSAGEAGYGAVSGNFKFSEGGRGRYEIRLWGSMYFRTRRATGQGIDSRNRGME
jgi:hypothetical protein